jgi:tellurite resistance protein TehA-like permease
MSYGTALAELSPLIIIILTMLVLIGLAMWFIRHVHAVEKTSESTVSTLLDGLYWAVVTMTTVGYGDKTPKTTSGRVVAIAWMLSSWYWFHCCRPGVPVDGRPRRIPRWCCIDRSAGKKACSRRPVLGRGIS